MLRREYLSLVVNVLTNSVKISDPTLADFAQLNLPRIHEKVCSKFKVHLRNARNNPENVFCF